MSQYHPGVCNIGAEEIAVRRRSGHVGSLATVVVLSALVGTNAPRWSRLFVALPAAVAASGYLQAREHFCAGFGSRGVYNFGPTGQTEAVPDPDDRARDVRTARRIGAQGAGIGLAVGVAALALPTR